MASAGPLRLPIVTVGPRAQGRNYGLMGAIPDATLTETGKAMLEDFALALAEWARGPDEFSAFFEIDPAANLYGLCRARYLRRSELGEVAVAHFALVRAAQLEVLGWASHRLVQLVPWPQEGRDPPEALLVRPPAAEPRRRRDVSYASLARRLAWGQVLFKITDNAAPETAVAALLEAAPERIEPAPTWVTTDQLARNGRFDPERAFQLVVTRGEPNQPQRPVASRLAGGELVGSEEDAPSAWRAWEALFPGGVADDPELARMAADLKHLPQALSAIERLRWRRADYAQLSPEQVIAAAVQQALGTLDGVVESQMALFIPLALRSTRISQPKLRKEASDGIVAAFDRWVNAAPSIGPAALRFYIERIEHMLVAPPRALPARLAVQLSLLAYLDEALVEQLAGRGLGVLFAAETAAAVQQAVRPAALAGLMRGLERLIVEGKATSDSLMLLNVCARLAAASGQASLGEPALRAQSLMMQQGHPADARHWPYAEVAALAVSPAAPQPARSELLACVSSALRTPGSRAELLALRLALQACAPRAAA